MTGHGPDIGARLAVTTEILEERRRQAARFGEQNHPSLAPRRVTRFIAAGPVREMVRNDAALGHTNWRNIALEEFCEACEAPDERALRTELIQLSAVIVAWIECIDRRVQTSAEAASDTTSPTATPVSQGSK